MLKKEILIKHLVKRYKPEVILLGGSRAKNTQRPDSDWDIYLVGNYNIENEQFSEQFLGEHLDIALFPKFLLVHNVLRLFYGPVSDLEALLDNETNLGSQIVNATREAYTQKPDPLSSAQIINKLNYLNRILSKMYGFKEKPEIYYFHLAQFYQTIFPYWFEFQEEWSVPIQYAMPIIKSRDSQFHKMLDPIINKSDISNQILACQNIVDDFRKKYLNNAI